MPRPKMFVIVSLAVLALCAVPNASRGQAVAPNSAAALASAEADPRPLPDIPTLMHQVEHHQQLAEAVQKDYIYRSSTRIEREDKQGKVKQTDTRVTDVFYLDGVPVERLVEHNGKALSPDEEKKESERIDRQVARARERLAKAEADGKPTDSAGHPVITVSRLLELGSFTNPRRTQINSRPTIVVDFHANPGAKPRNPGESVIHDMAGTLWIDEQDRAIQHLEGAFVDTFKIGGGLVANISKGTHFTASNVRINNEVWLPSWVEAQGHIRFLLFFNIDGNLAIHNSDYRKFKVTSTIVPATPEAALVPATPEAATPQSSAPPPN